MLMLARPSVTCITPSASNRYPDAVHIIAGDFNQADLKVVIKCATRGGNTLDKVYTNIKQGYRTTQLPHLGSSDHMSLFLKPAYTPLRKKNTLKTHHKDGYNMAKWCLKAAAGLF